MTEIQQQASSSCTLSAVEDFSGQPYVPYEAPYEVMGNIFSFISPEEGKNVCSVCRHWKKSWEIWRYQQILDSLCSFKGMVEGRTLCQCFVEFSQEIESDFSPTSVEYGKSLKTVQAIHCVVREALSYLTPEEKKPIELYPVMVKPAGVVEHVRSWVTERLPWLFKKAEPVYVQRKIWQIAEEPAILQLLFEKAFLNRSLYLFFGGVVSKQTPIPQKVPPWETIQKIRTWLQTSASVLTAFALNFSRKEGRQKITVVPPEIGACSNLETLELIGNYLSSLPPELGRLTHLQTVRLGNNYLKTFVENCSSLTQLEGLYLQQNALEDLPMSLKEIRLQTLDISSNPFKRFPQVLFELKSLRDLYMSSDQAERFRDDIIVLRHTVACNIHEIKFDQAIKGTRAAAQDEYV